MKKILILLLSISLLFSCSNNEKIDENKCQDNKSNLESFFDEDAKSLNIKGKGLTQVPDFNTLPEEIKEEVMYITLIDNEISSVSDEDFDMFPNLIELSLAFNNIEKINFSSDTLLTLSLSKNKITKVDLSGSDNLEFIDLSFNQIESTSDLDLPKINLKKLLLNSNKLTDISELKDYYNLFFLRLEFNDINVEDLAEALSELPYIKFVTTAGNPNIPKEKVDKLNKWSLENKKKYGFDI